MNLDWSVILPWIIGALGGVMLFGKPLLHWVKLIWPHVLPADGETAPITLRGSDAKAPSGTAEYLADLRKAAPTAPADFILSQAAKGATVACTLRCWVEWLEARKEGRFVPDEVSNYSETPNSSTGARQ